MAPARTTAPARVIASCLAHVHCTSTSSPTSRVDAFQHFPLVRTAAHPGCAPSTRSTTSPRSPSTPPPFCRTRSWLLAAVAGRRRRESRISWCVARAISPCLSDIHALQRLFETQNDSQLKQVDELELAPGEDAPMSMAAARKVRADTHFYRTSYLNCFDRPRRLLLV